MRIWWINVRVALAYAGAILAVLFMFAFAFNMLRKRRELKQKNVTLRPEPDSPLVKAGKKREEILVQTIIKVAEAKNVTEAVETEIAEIKKEPDPKVRCRRLAAML